jgi:hypothetical protein
MKQKQKDGIIMIYKTSESTIFERQQFIELLTRIAKRIQEKKNAKQST